MIKEPRREDEDKNTWNALASVFFVCVLVLALLVIRNVRGSFPSSISLFDFVLITLAAFRITRLVVYDKITRFFREWFVAKRVEEMDGQRVVVLMPLRGGVRGTIHDLLGCPWCIGIWSALAVFFCYFVFPWAWFIIAVLAAAGLSSFIQITANMIGWAAEGFKKDVSAAPGGQNGSIG